MEKVIDKCDLYFEGDLISRERLIQTYANFIAKTFEEKDHNVGIILHTGSICFDIVSVMTAAISNLILNESDVDDVINSLEINDIVLYDKQRYIFGGYADNDLNRVDNNVDIENIKYFLLIKDEKDKTWIPIKNKYKLEPYNGQSKRMDGRGIRKDYNKRLNFISTIFEIPVNEIPSVINASSLIVMPRDLADRIINGLVIYYNQDKSVKLLDIVTASYYSENDEYPYGGNPGKTEPVLKITGKISVARDLIFERNGNKISGLSIIGADSVSRGRTELPELMNRRSLKYVYVSYHIDWEYGDSIINEYHEANLFACTKDFLLSNSLPVIKPNRYTSELDKQVENIIGRQVCSITVESDKTWNDYREIKKSLYLMRKSEIGGEDKEYFIIHANSLLNLFLTAVFPINRMEELITSGELDIVSPKKKIEALHTIAENFSGSEKEKAVYILKQLECLYLENAEHCKKESALKKYLVNNKDKYIAVIVPKAYYADILFSENINGLMVSPDKLVISTANKFDNTIFYDGIIIVGDFKGRRFETFKCRAAADIYALIYEFESNIFNYKLKEAKKTESFYNQKSRILVEWDNTYSELYYDDINVDDEDIQEFESISVDLDYYINRLNETEARTMFNKAIGDNVSTTDVVMIGIFAEGERIFFTKAYKALVFNSAEEDVKEVGIDDLVPGDILIFTKNSDLTKNIVNNIFDNLLNTGKLSEEIKTAAFKSEYWKLVLQEYMDNNNFSYRKLSEKLAEFGCKKHEVTLRSWLEKEYHIVGPTDEDTFVQIANMAGDVDMISDPKSFHEACKIIRQKRTEILKLIGHSIINKLRGKVPENDMLFEAVYDNVDKLAVMLQLESISNVEEQLFAPVNMVNRPIVM